MSTDDELLARFRPVLQFDSQESFPADAAATLSDRPGKRAEARRRGLALAGKGSSVPLDVDTLDGTTYPTGAPARAGDYLDATGKDYVAQARAMHREPYADRIHGHAVRDAAGRLWLQYWFFHYYNDKAFLGVGLHEGDWEMIQVRLGADEQLARQATLRPAFRAGSAARGTPSSTLGDARRPGPGRRQRARLPRLGLHARQLPRGTAPFPTTATARVPASAPA